MRPVTNSYETAALPFTPEQRSDAEDLLTRLWPEITDSNFWTPGSGLGKGVVLDASKHAACESWLRCHAPAGFSFQRILLHVNSTYRWHVHEKNTGTSLLVGLSDYAGGELEVRGDGVFPTSASMVLFDGRRPHRTRDFVGLRVTLVAFSVEE